MFFWWAYEYKSCLRWLSINNYFCIFFEANKLICWWIIDSKYANKLKNNYDAFLRPTKVVIRVNSSAKCQFFLSSNFNITISNSITIIVALNVYMNRVTHIQTSVCMYIKTSDLICFCFWIIIKYNGSWNAKSTKKCGKTELLQTLFH